MTEKQNKSAVNGKTEESTKKPFLYSAYYDSSDVDKAAKTAYDEAMDETELRKRRKRDWIFLAIGIPALIGLMYLIVMISGR